MIKGIVRRVESYDENLIRKVLEDNRDFILKDLNKNDNVLVKPNLLSYNPPEKAVTTHPVFIRSVVRFLLDNDLNVFIGDIPGRAIGLSRFPEMLGVVDLKSEKLKIVDLALEGFFDAKDSIRGVKVRIPKILLNMKRLFNLPKMKTHSLTFITGATKNLFGLTPRKDRLEIHSTPSIVEFSKFLVDLYESIPISQIVIMDGIVGMEGDGPSYGNPVNLNSMIISNDAIYADFLMSKIMGFDFKDIPLFQVVNLTEGELDGDIDSLIKNCKKPKTFYFSSKATSKIASLIYGLLQDTIQPVPDVNTKKCIKCGICAQRCPGGAIKLDPYPVFDRNKCILCFCCHELCPQGAIYLRRSIFSKIFKT